MESRQKMTIDFYAKKVYQVYPLKKTLCLSAFEGVHFRVHFGYTFEKCTLNFC